MSILRLKGPSEKEIENDVLFWLSYQRDVMAMKINTVGVWDPNKKIHRSVSKYVRRGTPDILIHLNHSGLPIIVWFEVKSESGRQSPEQKDFEDELLRKLNGFYFVIRSVGQAESALNTVRTQLQGRLLKLKYS